MVSADPRDYERLYNALVLPYEPGSFEIDYERFETYLRYHLDHDPFVEHGGLVVLPEAGEVFYLDDDEYRRTVSFALDVIDGVVPTFVGVVGLRRETLVDRAAFVDTSGADGVFLLPPMGSLEVVTAGGSRAYPEVWVDHVRAVADRSDLPIIVHPVAPVSSAYGAGLPLEPTLAVLEAVPSVVGWKMTYNREGYDRIAEAIRGLDRHVSVLCASGSYYQEKLAAGSFDGSVSGSFNYALEPMVRQYAHWLDGDIAAATRIWDDGLGDLHDYVYAERKTKLHPRYKAAAWLRGFVPHPYMRPPMPAVSRPEVETIHGLLREAGLETIDAAERDRVLADPVRSIEGAERAAEPADGRPAGPS